MLSRKFILPFAMMLSFSVLMNAVVAAPQSREELKDRFEQRYPELNRLKGQGKVGETVNGFIEAVKKDAEPDNDVRKLIDEENRDRRKLYEGISEKLAKEGKSVPADKVAERNARRNYMNAKPSEFLKSKDGVWVQRRDLTDLKRKGQVGETAEGYIAAVEGQDLSEKAAALVEVENVARREDYYRQAKDNASEVEKIAETVGKKNVENARAGESVRMKDGQWQKKK